MFKQENGIYIYVYTRKLGERMQVNISTNNINNPRPLLTCPDPVMLKDGQIVCFFHCSR